MTRVLCRLLAPSLAFLLACLLAGVVHAQQPATLNHTSNLRTGPYPSSKNKGTLPAGTVLHIVSKYPRLGYVRIQTDDGMQVGWVLEKNVDESAAPAIEPPNTTTPGATGAQAGPADVYPDSSMTPGKPDPTVTQANIADNICNKAWTTDTVRPAVSVTNKIKKQTMAAYGFTDSKSHYELDHLVSLQVGGCPDCVENLWPEAYGDRAHPMTQKSRSAWNKAHPGSDAVHSGALEKDVVENHVHDEICFGIPNAKLSSYSKKYPATVRVTLARGQQILATDWYSCYRNIMDGNKPCE
ncbi:MAG: SH3 domain-containing protein [Acidobacteriota bacterium]|nr:SH3 domain-containing protein [Acidobacteriota bacterium]